MLFPFQHTDNEDSKRCLFKNPEPTTSDEPELATKKKGYLEILKSRLAMKLRYWAGVLYQETDGADNDTSKGAATSPLPDGKHILSSTFLSGSECSNALGSNTEAAMASASTASGISTLKRTDAFRISSLSAPGGKPANVIEAASISNATPAFLFNAKATPIFETSAQDAPEPFECGVRASSLVASSDVEPEFTRSTSAPPDIKPNTLDSTFSFSMEPSKVSTAKPAFNFSGTTAASSLPSQSLQFNVCAAPTKKLFSKMVEIPTKGKSRPTYRRI